MLDYGAGWMDGMSEGRGVWRAQERVFLTRDKEAEDAARENSAISVCAPTRIAPTFGW
jgi:hypothetical protein